ncbi:hypothetical protein BDR04DRAFT_1164521 [Suillus decipiens]|nr:hypothetical protein BDR04DRAFT_1164521 [Suillus decipiens]
MPIGVADESRGIAVDGILGIGPVGLTVDTLLNRPGDTFATITDYLHTQRVISQPLIGIFFKSSTIDINDDGQLSLGETDPAPCTGNLRYTYRAVTGAIWDVVTDLLTITLAQYNVLQPLNFRIGQETYSLTHNTQIWPRSLNSAVNGVDGVIYIYLVVKSLIGPTGGELIGYGVLVLFDYSNTSNPLACGWFVQ